MSGGMVIAATHDKDFWLLLGIYVLAALVIAYWAPRLLGLMLFAPLRAIGKVLRRAQREPR
jgi:hypothetical protein